MSDMGQSSTATEMEPLGDMGLLVRFGRQLSDEANRAVLRFAARLTADPVPGVVEVVPSLVSVLVRYEPGQVGFQRLAGELALRMQAGEAPSVPRVHTIDIRFDGEDVAEVSAALKLSAEAFVNAHNAKALRVLTTGFAPGFVYCGLHDQDLTLPRRTVVRQRVEAGTVLFAAGQTAIAATDIPTGWHVIGHTDFRNFDPSSAPPTTLRPGDLVQFRAIT
jgi:KipI family sensor histidine kinase inhibitor